MAAAVIVTIDAVAVAATLDNNDDACCNSVEGRQEGGIMCRGKALTANRQAYSTEPGW